MGWKRALNVDREHVFKARVVQLILMRETGEALETLSQHYRVDVPNLKVGMPKKYSKKIGCYVSKTKTIHVRSREKLEDPFVILHEFLSSSSNTRSKTQKNRKAR